MGGTYLLTVRPVSKAVILWLTAIISALVLLSSTQSALAATTIATGTITDENSSPLQGVQIDCLTGENNSGANSLATSSANGAYTCSVEGTLTTGTPVSIQPRSFEGYRSPQQQNFTWNGTAQSFNFQYQSSPKTINVTVAYEDGQAVNAVQVTAQPINLEPGESASQVQEDFQGGSGDLSVTGGEWIVKADANFSETNAESYPWISITQPIMVVFNDDSVIESTDIAFVVAKSQTKVTLTLLDADGAKLNEGFVGDAYFEGFSGTYGALSTSRKVNPTTGASELYLLPGVWRVKALDTQFDNESFSIEDATFVIPDEAGTYDLGTIQASVNQGTLSGSVTVGDAAGANLQLVAANIDTGDRTMATSTSTGEFTINNLSNGNYSVTVSQDGYIATQSATGLISDENSTVTGLVVTAEAADTTVKGDVVDETGSVLTNVPGSVVVKGENVEFSAPVQTDGSFELKMYTAGLPDDEMQLEFVPQPGADVFAPEPVTVPVEPNSTFETNLATSTDEAAITGNITNFAGDELGVAELGNKPKIMAMNAETGAVETTTIATDGSFTLNVGPGEWSVIPQLNDPNATALPANTSSINVVVAAGDETTANVPMLEAKGTVAVTVTDPAGNAVPEAPVLFTNLPSLQAEAATSGEPIDQNKIVQIASTADASGVINASLPEGEFTAYFGTNPDVDQYAEPAAITVDVQADQTVTAEGEYKEADSTVSGSIGAGFDNGSITFSSPTNGTETFPIDENGDYTGSLAEGSWDVIVSGVKNGEVFLGEDAVTIDTGSNEFESELTGTDVDFPAAVTVSGQADEPLILSNTDGASVSMPAYSAGFSGSITATLQPVISFENNGDLNQVGLAYEVTVVDEDGTPVSTLNSPATVTLPLPEALVGSVDKTEMTGAYFNPNLETFLSDGVVATTNGTEMVLQTKHFSRFAVTTSENNVPSKPTGVNVKKIKQHSAVVDWKAGSGVKATKYKLQIRKKGVTKQARWIKYNKVKKTQQKVTSLKSNTVYQARVKACAGDVCSDFTKWKKFKTK
ncbi:MAG: carboxypeptidase regulatory-like domain-containing protein [Candidatus Kerfeldbacteria bacterium]|nr:carboxypeptidase regulatory-like domain-containing protein [Candidatus Kerfeldbacteria bacterium]